MTKDERVGWYHQLDGHEFEPVPRVGDGQGSLACCSPWGSPGKNTGMGMRFESEHDFAPPTLLLGLLLCSWT